MRSDVGFQLLAVMGDGAFSCLNGFLFVSYYRAGGLFNAKPLSN
jgi:hypothetical protein